MTNLPTATYRLQLNSQFTFDNAIAILEYLAALNISHIYTAPYLQAAAGSMHGYDVADFSQVNREIGGAAGRIRFCVALKKQHLKQVIDVVPNHMAAKSPDNIWWTNVLKYGLRSPYAKYFDIYWEKSSQIMLSILEADFDQVVTTGKIKLQLAHEKLALQYFEHTFPLAPASLLHFFSQVAKSAKSDQLIKIVKRLSKLPASKYYEHAENLEQQLVTLTPQSDTIRQAFEQTINIYNSSPKLLTALHKAQNYQLVFWQTSLHDISYRRFFHLNSLIGLRIEEQAVFAATHKHVLQWFKDAVIDGVRVDHIDGLRNPFQYLKRLHKILPKTWTVVEKILSPGEQLPNQWPVAGTTGYEFLTLATKVLIDSRSEDAFTEFYANFINEKSDYPTVLREKKLLVLQRLLAADVNFLTDLVIQISQRHKNSQFSRPKIRAALQAIVACFPRYRTYIEPEKKKISAEDKKVILTAIRNAKIFAPKINPKLFDFLGNLLLLKHAPKIAWEFVLRFQQLTSPAMAKGGEDTALYCYNRFVALNDVGSDPGKFGISVADFHQAMLTANDYYPHSMLTTSTHDTKRSEDVRARLVLLSEIGAQWFKAVNAWTAYNEKYHAATVPDRNTQYFLYQNLVGVWPISQERFSTYMQKAVREAETYTTWFFPNQDYETKLQNFIVDLFSDSQFRNSFETLVNSLIHPGRINSLSQVVLKLTAPGIPDIYQGSEIWNFSLVDPDNRLPVDFNLRKQLFATMLTLSPKEILQRMDAGLPKMWVIYKILGLRKKYPELFNNAAYAPLWLEGDKKQHGIAFLRDKKVLVVVPRLPLTLNGSWKNTWLNIPVGSWSNILTNETLQGGKIMIASLLQNFPVAVLLKKGEYLCR